MLEHKAATLPWPALEFTLPDLLKNLGGKQFDLGDFWLTLEREQVLRAAVKYGAAVAHVSRLYRHLESKGIPFELEVSVDETETPTTHAEHIYVASELRRLGVQWVSLAPRFVGRFEKGVDYIGDLDALAVDLAGTPPCAARGRTSSACTPARTSLVSIAWPAPRRAECSI